MEPTNYAMVQRAAVFTWEARTILLNTDPATAPIKVEFPQAVIIVAARPSVSVADPPSTLNTPTCDDIDVRIEQDTGFERRLTSRFDAVMTNGVGALPEVTLSTFMDSVGGCRIMNYELGDLGSRPELQVTFSWKLPPIPGTPPTVYWRSVFVSLAFLCNMKGRA
jgi:hypothetical protein